MIVGLEWLGLSALDPEATAGFYESTLGLNRVDPREVDGTPRPRAAFAVGDGHLVIRSLRDVPSGGVHTHFAITVTSERYEGTLATLRKRGPVTERTFGGHRSLYWFDPAGHCVEFAERPVVTGGIGELFEVVLEVVDLDRAEARYNRVGFETVDRGRERPRARLRGAFDLELWEPHLGIATARGGAHVELGLQSDAIESDASTIAAANERPRVEGAWRSVRDPDGHELRIGPAV